MPEVLVLVLHPEGNVRVVRSAQGTTELRARWRVVELWTLSAADLLATGDPGIMPWVPLACIDGPPEPVLQACRRIIDDKAKSDEHENLLSVTEVLAGLRFGQAILGAVFGERKIMVNLFKESSVLHGFLADRWHQTILNILPKRFGAVPPETTALKLLEDDDRLQELNVLAATCTNLVEFHQALGT